ncbi:MAG TPA: VOC family protein [Pseudonocardia sp.]|jgi:catechol 2,3-dioxygenase-like lactoylglutathione lyase family enzyme|nr:VOC family protein [Pseudonocardia sp.]
MSSASVHHTGLTVADIAVSTRFYELLGFTRSFEEPVTLEEDWAQTVIGLEKPVLLVMFLMMGEARLELIQFLRPQGAPAPGGASNDVGSAHLAISVSDVGAEYERLIAEGVEFVSKPVTVTGGAFAGITAVYGKDPDGNVFELINGL